ncbi:hypothetical protein Tco_1323865, partial [Tanacetum coccineum]
TAQEYESTAGANLSTAEVLNAHIRYHLKELRYCAQCLIIENEDFVKRLRDHYIEPTEFEIQEMVNIWVRDSARRILRFKGKFEECFSLEIVFVISIGKMEGLLGLRFAD